MAIPADFRAYYDIEQGSFWIQDDRQAWIKVNKENLSSYLFVKHGAQKRVKQGQGPSEVERFIVETIMQRSVQYAGPLSGYQPGLIEQHGTRILITNTFSMLPPKPGKWPLWGTFLENLLKDDLVDQRPYYFSWLLRGIHNLQSPETLPGQCLVIAGKQDCGKSFLQNRTTTLLGGRAAKPYTYMSGNTSFNRELFGAEHLMIEDVISSTDIRSRRAFGSRIKELVANEVQACHGKFLEAINVQPRWRVSVTVNDEPEDLMVLPPLVDGVADKFILLKANDGKIPKDIGRKEYLDAINEELPHFVHWLLTEWKVPEEVWAKRFGVRSFLHPTLLAAVNDLAPETQLHDLIQTHIFKGGAMKWEGTADELRAILLASDRDTAKGLLHWGNSAGSYLGRLHSKMPELYQSNRSARNRKWMILPDPSVENKDTTPESKVNNAYETIIG